MSEVKKILTVNVDAVLIDKIEEEMAKQRRNKSNMVEVIFYEYFEKKEGNNDTNNG